jgi:hypothetical protein
VTKLETGWGPLVERGGPSVEKVGEWCVESRHLQGCSLHLCQLRTDGLTSANKYWTYQSHASDMGPVSLLACHRQGAWLKPTTSLVGLGEKLGTDPRIDRSACWGLCREPFFSRAVRSVQIYRWLAKDCYALTAWDTYGLGPYADWAWDACDVLVRFSRTGCISIWIIVTQI